ncbi:MAG: type II/IV secretion system ATPase subunit [Crenarchaeota archaeon]|nr:type II/IV secretion system ATPase subunit [Thermoproteota archaeon]
MLASKPSPVGRRVELSVVEFCVRTFIDVRSIGSSFTIYVVDDVPDVELPDPYMIYERGSYNVRTLTFLKLLRKENNSESFDIIEKLWERWFVFYGPLTPLLLYDKISDIYIDSSGIHAYHVDLGLCEVCIELCRCVRYLGFFNKRKIDVSYKFEDFVKYIIHKISERTSNPVTAYMPMISVTDPDFKVRFSVSVRPISDPYIHVRVLPKRPWTFGDLIARGSLSVDYAALLWYLFDRKIPILIIGPMGGGKTSLANAITYCSNPILFKALILDVDEMILPGHNVVKLFERKAYGLGVQSITKRDLIAHALRVGADYVIVNEVRTRDEVSAWIDAVTSGHGGVTTFHAENMEKLKIRLENMIGSSKIVDEIAIVKMSVRTSIEESHGVRTCKKSRIVSKIVVPRDLDIDEEELLIRKQVVKEFIGKSYVQQLNMISEFYKNPDMILQARSS